MGSGVGLGTRVRARCHGRSLGCLVLWGSEIFISLVSFGFKAGAFGLASGGRRSQALPWGCSVWGKGAAITASSLACSPYLSSHEDPETQFITKKEAVGPHRVKGPDFLSSCAMTSGRHLRARQRGNDRVHLKCRENLMS